MEMRLTTLALAALFATTAAGDGLPKTPVRTAEPAEIVTVPTWTGFYVGPMAGIALSQIDVSHEEMPTNVTLGQEDWVWGLLAGVDFQFTAGHGARFHPVVGAWASIEWSNVKFNDWGGNAARFGDHQWAVGGRGCLTMSTTTLACLLAGWSEQSLKGDGDDKLKFRGPLVGVSLEVLLTERLSAGLRYTAFLPGDKSDDDGFKFDDRRDEVMATLVYRFGGKAPWN